MYRTTKKCLLEIRNMTEEMNLIEETEGKDEVYQFLGAVLTKFHRLGGLKQQRFSVSQFHRPEIQNQGISRDQFFVRTL